MRYFMKIISRNSYIKTSPLISNISQQQKLEVVKFSFIFKGKGPFKMPLRKESGTHRHNLEIYNVILKT